MYFLCILNLFFSLWFSIGEKRMLHFLMKCVTMCTQWVIWQ